MTIAGQFRRVIGPPRMAKQRPRNPQLIGDRCFSSDDLIGDRKHVAQISDDIDIVIDVGLAQPQRSGPKQKCAQTRGCVDLQGAGRFLAAEINLEPVP